ncbi:STAS domain-containing protein [Nocardia sp. X0981]
MRSPDQQLAFRLRRRGDIIVLSARGEADAYTLPLWRQQVREAVEAARTARGALIVDATRLDFLSLRTLAALAEEARRCRGDGVEICLVTSDVRLVRIAGGDPRLAHLSVRSTVVGALTVFELHKRSTPSVVRPPRYQPPRILPDEPEFEPEVRLRLLSGGNAAGPGSDFQGPQQPASLRRGR